MAIGLEARLGRELKHLLATRNCECRDQHRLWGRMTVRWILTVHARDRRMYRQQNATQERFCTNTLRKNRVIRPVSLIQNEIKGARPLNERRGIFVGSCGGRGIVS